MNVQLRVIGRQVIIEKDGQRITMPLEQAETLAKAILAKANIIAHKNS